MYPMVNVYTTMENHHFQWVNPLFLWSFSMSQTVKLPEGICEICMDHAAVIHPYLGIGVGQMRFYLGIVYLSLF